MFRQIKGFIKRESLYGLDVFDTFNREWVFTGYRPEAEARKAAEDATKKGGRVHLWRADRTALLAS
jgi:hypothetical protein